LKNHCLQKIETFLKGCGRSFQDFSTMPLPVYNEDEVDYSNRLIRDEMRYNKGALTEEHQQLLQNLTDEQKAVYKKIMSAVIQIVVDFSFYTALEVQEKLLFGGHYQQLYDLKEILF